MRIFLLPLILLAFFNRPTHAAPVVEGKGIITDVTLFQDRAFVSRKAQLTLKQGNYTVEIKDITRLLDVDSLKARIVGNNSAELLGLRATSFFRKTPDNPELKKLMQEKEQLEEQQKRLFSKARALLKEHTDLYQLANHFDESFALNLHSGKWSAKNLDDFLRFLENRSASMHGVWKKALGEYLKLYDRLQFVAAKIRELQSIEGLETYRVSVDLVLAGNSEFTLELQYLVSSAGWGPHYDLRIDGKKNEAKIEQHAIINQKSGEDWNNVTLTLSNVRSELKPVPPTIYPYSLSFKEVGKVKTSISARVDAIDDLSTGGSDVSPDLPRQFLVKEKQTIMSGMEDSKVFIQSVAVPYQEQLELVAAEFPRVYKRGTLTNGFPFLLAEGPGALFYDDEFVQNFHLAVTPKGKPFYVNAGIDHSISVNRWYSDKEDKQGLINQKKVYQRDFYTQLRNFSGKAKKMRILDQIPHSEVTMIEVKSDGSTSGLKPMTQFPSWVYWEIELLPEEKRIMELKLAVTVPSEFNFSWKE